MTRVCIAVGRIVFAIGAFMALAGAAGAQQAYPSKPIRFIVPFPPGGSTDPVARLIGQKLSESWGQQVIVDNRPGGSSIIGTEAVAKSPPDGYTILLAASTHPVNALLFSNLPYDSINDFAAIATLIRTEFALVVHPSVPANDLQEFIALAKSRAGQLNYATSGTGNPTHLAGELFNMMTGVKMQNVPYKGAGPAVADLLSGQVQLFFSVPISVAPFVKNGKLKAIAITGAGRSAAMPQVPTFAEAGLAGFDLESWQGVLAPAGTPKAIIDKMSAEIARILALTDVKEKLHAQGMEPFVSSPEQFAALIRSDMVKYGKVIKAANIKLD